MKSLTLTQLTKAIKELRAEHGQTTLFTDLVDGQGYMMRMVQTEPRDPRELLVELGYQW